MGSQPVITQTSWLAPGSNVAGLVSEGDDGICVDDGRNSVRLAFVGQVGNVLRPLPQARIIRDLRKVPGRNQTASRQFLFTASLEPPNVKNIVGIASG